MTTTQEIDPLLTRTQVRALFGGIARNTLHNWELTGKLPPPVRLSTRVSTRAVTGSSLLHTSSIVLYCL